MHSAVGDGETRTAVKVGRRMLIGRLGGPSAAAASTIFWHDQQVLSDRHKAAALLWNLTQLRLSYDAGLVRMAVSVSNVQLLRS